MEDRERNRNPGPIRHLFMRPRVVFIKRAETRRRRKRGGKGEKKIKERKRVPLDSIQAIVDTVRAYKHRTLGPR